MTRRGLFITFEGAEGSGKSTQIRRAAAYLKRKGYRVLVLREPGGTRVSEAVRRILLNKKFKEMTRETELLLYLAARAQIVAEKIRPALKEGKIVISDRFEDSTLAYQGYGREMPLAAIQAVSRQFVRGALRPDVTVLLDIDPLRGMKRGGRHDRMERQAASFHRRVRRGFLKLARRNRRRTLVLDARRSKSAITRQIREVLDRVV